MKKIIVIVASLVVVLGLAVGAWVYLHPSANHQAIEDFFPAKPLFYIRETNLAERLENFTKTKLYHDLAGLDYKKLAVKMGTLPKMTEEMEQTKANIFSPENLALVKSLFGKEVAVAVYSDGSFSAADAKNPAEAQKLFSQMAANVFVVTRVGADVKASELLAKVGGRFSKDVNVTSSSYKGKTINLIMGKDDTWTIGYTLINDFLVIGVGDKAAHSAIDVLTKEQISLSQDETFKNSQKTFTGDPDSIGFFDMQSVYQLAKAQILQLTKASPTVGGGSSRIEEQFKNTQGIETFAFSSKNADMLTGKFDLYFDPAKLQPEIRSYYTCSPDDNRTAKFIPWDAIYYQWNNCLDFSAFWQQYKRELKAEFKLRGDENSFDNMIKGYEQMLGLSLEKEILPALGQEFGIYLTDVNTAGLFPVPQMVIFIQSSSRDKMEAIMNKLLALQPMLKPTEESYEGETLHSIAIPFADNLKIGYGFIGNYFLLTSNIDVVKASILASKNPDKSITVNSAFQSTAGKANEKSNGLVFLQFDRLMLKTSAVFDWSIRMVQRGVDQHKAFLAGSKKNLEDVQANKQKLDADFKNLQSQLTLAQSQSGSEPTPEQATEIETLKKQIDANRQDMTANEDKEKQLNNVIKSYAEQSPKPMEDQKMIEDFVKPLLSALAQLKFIATKSVTGDRVIQSTYYLKME